MDFKDNFLHNLEKAVRLQGKAALRAQEGKPSECRALRKKAERLYKIALRRQPDNGTVHAGIGGLYIQQEMFGHAIHHFRRSLELDQTLTEPANNLAVALRHIGDDDEARDVLIKTIPRRPDDANLHANLGSVLFTTGDLDGAEWSLRKAIEIDENHHNAHWNLGLVLLSQRRWEEAWENYDWGFRAGERPTRQYVGDYPEWLGEDVSGATVLVWGEQGLGDEILFSSCVPDLIEAGAKVVMDCHPRLAPIFKRSFPDAAVVGARKEEDWSWLNHHDIDFHCPVGSLAAFFRKKDEDFPKKAYLKPDLEAVERWREKLGPSPRIGISWAGGSRKNAAIRRSIPLRQFAGEMVKNEATWVSLQYTDVYTEVKDFERQTGVPLHHDVYALENYEETANMVAALDLVITVPTAVGHLAGALGKEVWCLVHQAPAWRWAGENPWYGGVKHYHQEKRGEWGDVLKRVNGDLKTWLRS